MKKPSWESTPGALVALLNGSTAVRWADLYTITLESGAVLRYTSHDTAITLPVGTFQASNASPPVPLLARDRVSQSVGIAVDTMRLTMMVNDSVLYGSTTMAAAARAGLFNNATITLEKLFSGPDSFSPVGAFIAFDGRVGAVRPSRSMIELEVVSHTELLDTMVPAEVYQPGCRNTLYDASCGLSRTSYQHITTAFGMVNSTNNATSVNLSGAASPGNFALGVMRATSGPNAGISRTIKAVTPISGAAWNVQTILPWPFAFGAGDGVTLWMGCDKTRDTCSTRFNNLIRFRGEPYLPAPETVT